MNLHRLGLFTSRISGVLRCQHGQHMAYHGREANMLGKLMGKTKSRSRQYLPGNIGLQLAPGSVVEAKRKLPTEMISRRRIMLNKMFMRHISELIASDPISDDLNGYGLEICDVQVIRNYGTVNVYWSIDSKTDDFAYVQNKLQSIAGKLRSQLTRMQVMGMVPDIRFIQDKRSAYMTHLNELIEKADYGEDYVPGQRNATIKHDFDTDTLDQGEDPLLSMRHDILGLNHSGIMGRVKQHLAKARQQRKNFEEQSPNTLGPAKAFTLTTSLHDIRNNAVQRTRTREVLLNFLRLKRRQRKELSQYNQAQYLQQEEEEEAAYDYEEDVDLDLCPEDDEAYLNEYFYNRDIDGFYEFNSSIEEDMKTLNVQSKNDDGSDRL